MYQPHGLLEMHVTHYRRFKLFSAVVLILSTSRQLAVSSMLAASVQRQRRHSVRREDQEVTLACQLD